MEEREITCQVSMVCGLWLDEKKVYTMFLYIYMEYIV